MTPDDHRPSWLSRAVRRLLVWLFRTRGWKAVGSPPPDRRCVIVAVPHTSNWDFLYFVGLTDSLGIRPHFMAKQSLFRWPFRRFLLDIGGVPIDRSSSLNVVEQMVAEFERRDEFMLTIAPEGTRKAVTRWKTGFYQIAYQAKVPLVCGIMDYRRKVGGLGPAIMPSGDYRADMEKIVAFYRQCTPRHPERAVPAHAVLLGEEPEDVGNG